METMAGMPENSVDAIVCDPPYELSSGKPRVGYENCLRWVLLNVSFPNLDKSDAKSLQAFDLAGVLAKAPLLSGIRGSVGVGAGVDVPVGSVDLEDSVKGGKEEVADESKAPPIVAEGELPDVLDSQSIQLCSDHILQLRGSSDLAFCKGTCGCFRYLSPGRLAVNVVVPRSSLGNSLNGSASPRLVSLRADGVGLSDDALGNSNGATGVVAGAGAELPAVLALDTRRGAFELLPASGAREAHFILNPLEPEGIGASAGAGGLASELETGKVGGVDDATSRANPLGCVLIHRKFSAYLKRIIPQKGFMGRVWDGSGVAFSVDMWREAWRVTKPGAYLMAFGGTRRYHRMVSAIEDAGFEVIDTFQWIYGSGFPKSHNVQKALEKLGEHEAAQRFAGYGTAAKPAHEPIVCARKPLSEGGVARNVLKHGTGSLNIDGCRVGTTKDVPASPAKAHPGFEGKAFAMKARSRSEGGFNPNQGRWPSNLLLSHSELCAESCHESCPIRLLDEQSGQSKSPTKDFAYTRSTNTDERTFNGTKGKADARLGEGAKVTSANYGDQGGSSRFFQQFPPEVEAGFKYCAKSSRRERNAGLEGMPEKPNMRVNAPRENEEAKHGNVMANSHPTVKPISLMRYLVRLVTPPGGTVLDPFAGSGSTGCAALQEGFDFVGIEMSEEYAEIAERRIAHWSLPEQDRLDGKSAPKGSGKRSAYGLLKNRVCNVCGSRANGAGRGGEWPECGHGDWRWVEMKGLAEDSSSEASLDKKNTKAQPDTTLF